MVYACIDKITNKPIGMIRANSIEKLEERYIVVKVNESFGVRQHYEIKYEDGKVRAATQQEIDDFLAQQEMEAEIVIRAKTRETTLKALAVTEQQLEDITNPVDPKVQILSLLQDEEVKTVIKEIKTVAEVPIGTGL